MNFLFFYSIFKALWHFKRLLCGPPFLYWSNSALKPVCAWDPWFRGLKGSLKEGPKRFLSLKSCQSDSTFFLYFQTTQLIHPKVIMILGTASSRKIAASSWNRSTGSIRCSGTKMTSLPENRSTTSIRTWTFTSRTCTWWPNSLIVYINQSC